MLGRSKIASITGVETMAKKQWGDEHFGFAHARDTEAQADKAATDAPVHGDGAYEDSWYQVLKAQADEAEEA
jgi:hypothetical protein